MNLIGPELVNPVFEFIEPIIREDGDIVFMVFAYAAVLFLAWVLCGGLRRGLVARQATDDRQPVRVIYLPLAPSAKVSDSPPPSGGQNGVRSGYEDEDACGGD